MWSYWSNTSIQNYKNWPTRCESLSSKNVSPSFQFSIFLCLRWLNSKLFLVAKWLSLYDSRRSLKLNWTFFSHCFILILNVGVAQERPWPLKGEEISLFPRLRRQKSSGVQLGAKEEEEEGICDRDLSIEKKSPWSFQGQDYMTTKTRGSWEKLLHLRRKLKFFHIRGKGNKYEVIFLPRKKKGKKGCGEGPINTAGDLLTSIFGTVPSTHVGWQPNDDGWLVSFLTPFFIHSIFNKEGFSVNPAGGEGRCQTVYL